MQYNKLIIVGNIATEPELRTTGTGVPVVNFRLACNTKLSAEVTKTTFIDVAAFAKLAETVQKYCVKGSNILVEGRLDEDQWAGDNGEKKFKHFVTAFTIKFIDTKTNEPVDTI